jgi:hypothetical protein
MSTILRDGDPAAATTYAEVYVMCIILLAGAAVAAAGLVLRPAGGAA